MKAVALLAAFKADNLDDEERLARLRKTIYAVNRRIHAEEEQEGANG